MSNATILVLNASGRYTGSVTRDISKKLASELQQQTGLNVVERDLAKGLEIIDEQWIGANFTDESVRSSEQNQKLAFSDELINEVEQAKYLILASPIYNFGVPSVFKAWIDQIARARKTFRYTENGPEGLLKEKKAFLVMASGGVPIGSEMDFATGYLKFVLGFVGISDSTVVNGNELSQIADDATLQQQLAQIVTG